MTFETMNHTMNQHPEQQQQQASSSQPAGSTIDLYVVQKCWFAGTKVPPAVDYSRLLTSLTDAEQVAYQSAHLYNTNGKKGVRTIQLQNGVGYGFVASGLLFWVRRVQAACTATTPPGGSSRFGEAYGVVQEGILGGNPHARRTVSGNNSNTAPICCFVGPHSSHAAMQCLQEQLSHCQDAVSRQVQWFPVGNPATIEQLRQEWPDHAQWLQTKTANANFRSIASDNNNNNNVAASTNTNMTMDDDSQRSASKRGTENENGTGLWFNNGSHCYVHNNTKQQQQPIEEAAAAAAAFCGLTAPPPTKRACRMSGGNTADHHHAYPFLNEIHHNGHHHNNNNINNNNDTTVSMME